MLRRRVVLLVFVALSLPVNTAGAAPPPIPFSSCNLSANSAGRSYVLTTDIVCAGVNGVNVLANNVTVDLKGHAITGDGGGEVGVNNTGGFDDVRIRNGALAAFTDAVRVSGGARANRISGLGIGPLTDDGVDAVGSNHVVTNNQIADVAGDGVIVLGSGAIVRANGIRFSGGNGINVSNSTGAIVASNNVSDTGMSGIAVGGTDCVVKKNTVVDGGTDPLEHGIDQSGNGCVVSGNYVSASSGIGINGGGPLGARNDFVRNIVTGNSGDGVAIFGAARSLVAHNVVTDNGNDGLEFGGDRHRIESNTVTGNALIGIRLGGGPLTDIVRDNNLSANDSSGLFVGAGAYTITGNVASANGHAGGDDNVGVGIDAGAATSVQGTNVANANDNPVECIAPPGASPNFCV